MKRCLNCHYDLQKLAVCRCPECGREFDPKNPRTFITAADLETIKGDRHFWRGVLATCAAIAIVLIVLLLTGNLKT